MAQPYARTVSPGEGHWAVLRKLLRDSGSAGNLTSDAHLAALAIELGASICSTDGDFERFPGVERVNPRRPVPHTLGVAREEGLGVRVRVMDFGLARASAESRLTRTGMLMGTLADLSPEQIVASRMSVAL